MPAEAPDGSVLVLMIMQPAVAHSTLCTNSYSAVTAVAFYLVLRLVLSLFWSTLCTVSKQCLYTSHKLTYSCTAVYFSYTAQQSLLNYYS